MKTRVLVFLLIFYSFSLAGQNSAFRSVVQQSVNIDTVFSRYYNIPTLIPLQDYSLSCFPILANKLRKASEEHDIIFPGASRYYANMTVQESVYDKEFIITPDIKNKYYLIIIKK